jgi:hypothetical protein
MPGMDGTGPLGMGPMTGRGFGRCRWNFAANRSAQAVKLTTAEEVKILEAELEEIKKRLKELKE